MSTSTAFGFVPEVELSCDGLSWSHPETSTNAGQPGNYYVSVNGGEFEGYVPRDVLEVAWPEDGSQVVVTLQGEYGSGFKHQLGQTKREQPEECVYVEPVEEVEWPIPEVPVASVEVPVSVPEAMLPETGVDPLLGAVAAVVVIAIGLVALRCRVAGV